MKRMLRALALLLSGVMMLALASCGNKDENKIHEDTTVLTVDGHDIPYGLYRYFFLNYKSVYPDDVINASPEEMYDKLHQECLTSLRGMYAVIALCADYGIKLDDEDIREGVKATKEKMKEQFADDEDKSGERGFAEELESNFMTESVFEIVFGLEYCEEKLYNMLTAEGGELYVDDNTFRTIVDEQFIRVKQVYIDINEPSKIYSACRDLAYEIREKAASGANFRELVAQYSNDYAMTDDGYYMPRGYMTPAFEDVAFALEEDQVSEVLELDDGFHIIKRFGMEDEYIEANLLMLKDRYYSCLVQAKVDARETGITVREEDTFAKVDFAKIAMPKK